MRDKGGKVAVYIWFAYLPCNCHFPLTTLYPNKFSATGDVLAGLSLFFQVARSP